MAHQDDRATVPVGPTNCTSSPIPTIQLYTLGDSARKDLDHALQQVAGIGYRAVEFPGHYGHPARRLRVLVDAHGLACPSMHVALRPLPGLWDLDGDLAEVAHDIGLVGAKFAVVGGPWLPDDAWQALYRTMAGEPQSNLFTLLEKLDSDVWKITADQLNEKGSELAKSGLSIAYHNHDIEFRSLSDGTIGYDILMERTDPGIVSFELDIGWATSSGTDVVELLEKLNERIALVQLQDVSSLSDQVMRLNPADVGAGIVDWAGLVPLIRKSRAPNLIIEQDPSSTDSPIDAARAAYQFLSDNFINAD